MSSTDATREAKSKPYLLLLQAEPLVVALMANGLDQGRLLEIMGPG